VQSTPPQRAHPLVVGRQRALSWFVVLATTAAAACDSSSSDASFTPPAESRAQLTLAADFTYGDALCGAPSADGSLFVAAEGASIAVLDSASLAAGGAVTVLARAPTTAAPYALVCDGPDVFIAGGTEGLWRVTIADGDTVGTVDGRWSADVRILDADGAAFLDVALLANHPAGEFVAAVTSARVGFGTSELVVVNRAAPHALRARIPLVPETQAAGAKAYALAADPIDSSVLYVAMGSAGIWRVDLADLALPVVVRGPIFDLPSEQLGGGPAAARDIACVRAGDRTILFAAIDSGGLAQVDVTDDGDFGPSMATARPTLECDAQCGPVGIPYAFRVAAIARADGRVLVALATNDAAAERVESGPFSVLGRWRFDLELELPGIGLTSCTQRTFLLRGEPGAPGPARTVSMIGAACRNLNSRSIALIPRGEGVVLFEQRFDGARASEFPANVWTSASIAVPLADPPWAGPGASSIDGTASAFDAGFLYFGVDGISARPIGALRFDRTLGVLEPMTDTKALCETGDTQFCNSAETAVIPPNPWSNGLAGGAAWIDATDPGREWFASGKSRVSRQCAVDPCAWTDAWCLDPWLEEGDAPSSDGRPPGWEIVRLDSGAASAGGSAMDLEFWSIASPENAFGRTGRNYFGSVIDPGVDGSPRLLHLFRGVIREGYLVCSADEVVQSALGTCPEARGRGQRIEPSWMHVLTTHYELEPSDDASQALTWRGEPFAMEVAGERRAYLAIATGWVVPTTRAPWDAHQNRASLLVYEVTHVDAENAPRLVRILFGPPAALGNAVAVRSATLGGRTWLFAGDLAGAAHAYDVSPTVLVDGEPVDPTDPATALEPAASWYAPPDAYDGRSANVTDIELDVDTDPTKPVLVLANARRGIAVIDVEFTNGAVELREAGRSPIDTPGIVSGVVPIRWGGSTWFAIGDARCGVRIYQRTP